MWMAAPSIIVASTVSWQRGQLPVEVGLVELVGVGSPSCKEPMSPCQHSCKPRRTLQGLHLGVNLENALNKLEATQLNRLSSHNQVTWSHP